MNKYEIKINLRLNLKKVNVFLYKSKQVFKIYLLNKLL